MRRFLVATLLIGFIWSNSATAAEPLTETQIARLESLCRVWGTVKFFHPWIVAPSDGKPIDWDAALIETIPLVEKASTLEEFRAAIDHLLSALHDPSTKTMSTTDSQRSAARRTSGHSQAEVKFISHGGKTVAVIDGTDWSSLGFDSTKARGGVFATAFDEAKVADAIVLDLRRDDTASDDWFAWTVSSSLTDDIAALLARDLVLPAKRWRFHAGYAADEGTSYRGYTSGISMNGQKFIRAKRGPSSDKPLVILTNSRTRECTPLLTALQTAGRADVLHDSRDTSNFDDGDSYPVRLENSLIARVRISDLVNSDGTIGFVPNVVLRDVEARDEDLMTKAIAVVCGESQLPKRPSQNRMTGLVPTAERSYPDMISPSREYRLLGLFKVWNVIDRFFAYKHLMDRSWDSLLTEFIPRFASADGPGDYGLLAQELVAHLQDSHADAYQGAATAAIAERFGRAPSSTILVQAIRGEMVVVAADESVKDQVRIGDVVVSVDDEPIAERTARFQKYFAASTPHALLKKVMSTSGKGPLTGPVDSPARLKVRGPDGSIRDAILPRTRDSDALQRLVQSRARKAPAYSVLPEGYGYFDLMQLEPSSVTKAFESVKATSALIMDLRGYPKFNDRAICARLIEKPMTHALAYLPYRSLVEPGTKSDYRLTLVDEPSTLWKYTAPIVVLINCDAISHAEGTAMRFAEAANGRITFIGTPTDGTNGDATNTFMPGGIIVRFTGLDVRHADGRQLQRVGIQPDIRVEPTIAGIVAGKDEVLEAAIKFLDESKAK